MKRLKSDIPLGAIEQLASEYKQVGTVIYCRITDCLLNGRLVGQRHYTQDGKLVLETPLKDGQKQGREYYWDDDGTLLSLEPFVQGKIHGTAKQYGAGGRLIGTYRLVHGTGLDVWREEAADGSISISEIHSLRDGLPHGYEWWFGASPSSIWHERHWYAGKPHGIERMWNSRGQLSRGYPKYWIEGQPVPKRKYLKAAEADKTLPAFRQADNSPGRNFPLEISQLLSP